MRATQLELTSYWQSAPRERIRQSLKRSAQEERVTRENDVAPRSQGVNPMESQREKTGKEKVREVQKQKRAGWFTGSFLLALRG